MTVAPYQQLVNRANLATSVCSHVVNVALHGVPLSAAEEQALKASHLAALDLLRNVVAGELTGELRVDPEAPEESG